MSGAFLKTKRSVNGKPEGSLSQARVKTTAMPSQLVIGSALSKLNELYFFSFFGSELNKDGIRPVATVTHLAVCSP